MVRRSSLIIAASLAVLSTFDTGSLCFAAAAPAAAPAEDRFERPRFLKKEIKRYVFHNSTMTSRQSTTDDQTTTTPVAIIPETTPPPNVLAASLSSLSLLSAEASWSSAHPGVPFGSPPGGDSATSAAAGAPTTNAAPAASTTQQPPPPASQSESQGPGGQGSSSNNNNNPPATPILGGSTPSPSEGGLIPSLSASVSVAVGGVPSVSAPGGNEPSHTEIGQQQPTGQSNTGGQQPGGQQTGGQETGGQQQQTGTQQTGAQQTGGQQPGGQQTGGQQTGGQQTGENQPTGKPNGPIPSQSIPIEGGSSQPVQTAQPATGSNAGVTPGSSPTNNPQSSAGGAPVVVPPPASHTGGLIAALSSALAISPQVNPQSAVNSLGQSLASAASPIIIGSSTNAAGVVLPITASTPAESSAGLPPVVIGSATDSLGHVVPILTAGLPTGSAAVPPQLVSTDANGVPYTASAPAQSGSAPVVLGPSGSGPQATGSQATGPEATGSAPVIVGSSTNAQGQVVPISSMPAGQSSGGAAPALVGSTTNSLGQVVPVTSAPLPAGSTTNAEGQVVPISSGAPPVSNDRFAHADVIPSASQGALPGTTQGPPPQTGVGASEPANTATLGGAQTPGSVPPPAPSTAGPGVPASSASVAPLPIATAAQSYNTAQNAPLTQLPTASDTMTEQPVASSIEVASSSAPTGVTGTVETGLPSGVPLVLYPPTGPVTRPANTELIQIGFLYPLNYDFVWQHEESQRQIFHYLPIGIAYGLSIDISNVTMQTLRAWDTTEDLHYITTLALAWIPSNLVDSLGLILHTQAEKFYHNPDPAVRTLLSMINPALPIRADNATDGGPQSGVGASPSGTANANGGTIANGINNSSPVKASSVGIGVGVVCGAAAYGAAMFFVARRYKKRRQSHLRSPSMYSSPVMSQHGADPAAAAALMSGGMGERSISPYYDNDRGPSRGSGRSGSSAGRQQISAPVMAENSLGWN